MIPKIALVLLVTLLCCKTKTGENQNEQDSLPALKVISKPLENSSATSFHLLNNLDSVQANLEITDTAEFYLVNTVCAVSVFPDTSWINEQKKRIPEDGWDEVVSDNLYYDMVAEDTLAAHGISVLHKLHQKPYLKFEKYDHSTYTLDKTKMKPYWGVILFNGKDNPVFWSGGGISEGVKLVYGK